MAISKTSHNQSSALNVPSFNVCDHRSVIFIRTAYSLALHHQHHRLTQPGFYLLSNYNIIIIRNSIDYCMFHTFLDSDLYRRKVASRVSLVDP